MSKQVRVPTPVYEAAKAESDKYDVSIGVIIRDWMHAAEQLEQECKA